VLLPQKVIPSLIGFPKLIKMSTASTKNETLAGLDCLKKANCLSLKNPIEFGIFTDWDEATVLLEHSFQQMKSKPEELEGGLLTTEAVLNPRSHREKMTEIIFEYFRVPKYFVQCQAMNALYSEGLTTAMVVDCGEGLSTCVPITDGYLNPSAISRLDIGGREVNFQLMKLLSSKALFTTTYEQSFI